MKRLFILIAALMFALVSFAQTPEGTVDRKSEPMKQLESNGLRMSEDVKIPILGARVADSR